jgi:HEAT repeat protein
VSDVERLAELVQQYALPTEASKVPLLDEMEACGAAEAVAELTDSPDADRRWLAGRLAELLPDKRHLPALERLAGDADPIVARQGLDALATQVRDGDWHEALGRLADGAEPETRSRAGRLLAGAVK